MIANPVYFPFFYACAILFTAANLYKFNYAFQILLLLNMVPVILIAVVFYNQRSKLRGKFFCKKRAAFLFKVYFPFCILSSFLVFSIYGIPLLTEIYEGGSKLLGSPIGRIYYFSVYKALYYVSSLYLYLYLTRFEKEYFLYFALLIATSLIITMLMGSKGGVFWLFLFSIIAIWMSKVKIKPSMILGMIIVTSVLLYSLFYYLINFRSDYDSILTVFQYLFRDRMLLKPAGQSGFLISEGIDTYYLQPFLMELSRISSKFLLVDPTPYFNEYVANIYSGRNADLLLTGAVIPISFISYYSFGVFGVIWSFFCFTIVLFASKILQRKAEIYQYIILMQLFMFVMSITVGSGNLVSLVLNLFTEVVVLSVAFFILTLPLNFKKN